MPSIPDAHVLKFISDVRGLKKPRDVEKLQDKFVKTLREYETKKGNISKFHKIIFLLPSIRSTAYKCMENCLLLQLICSWKLEMLAKSEPMCETPISGTPNSSPVAPIARTSSSTPTNGPSSVIIPEN